MDANRFDELSRRFATRRTRRSVLGLIGAAAAGVLTKETVGAASKQEKPTKCYGEGSHCTNGKQCCSNTCTNRQCTADVGPGTECTVATDCDGIQSECQSRTCIDGICGFEYAPHGAPAGDEILGDCETNVCNGAGGTETVIDDSDIPPAPSDCQTGICLRGVPSVEARPMYSRCASAGGSICDGAGHCVVCIPGDTQSCYSGPGGTAGVGVCRAGTKTCLSDGSGYGACLGEVHPSPETCNGLDDDCDGVVDEGASGVGASCDTGLVGSCAQGTVECQSGSLRCVSTVPPDSCCLLSGQDALGFCSQCCSGTCEASSALCL
jgi:hypothetical protein